MNTWKDDVVLGEAPLPRHFPFQASLVLRSLRPDALDPYFFLPSTSTNMLYSRTVMLLSAFAAQDSAAYSLNLQPLRVSAASRGGVASMQLFNENSLAAKVCSWTAFSHTCVPARIALSTFAVPHS